MREAPSGGAMAGAVIGEIANDDAGQGSGLGSRARRGELRGGARRNRARLPLRRRSRAGAQKQQATAQQIENFKKAFSVCLEGKQYLVKY